MNAQIQAELDDLQTAVSNLATFLDDQSQSLDTQERQREKLVQDLWRDRKELATLRAASAQMEALANRAEKAERHRNETRQRLRAILQTLKTLRAQLAP